MGVHKGRLRAGGAAGQELRAPWNKQGAAAPVLVQGWYKSPGPWRQGIYHSPRQKQANDFTGFIQNRRRESFLYRPDETPEYRRQGRCSHQHRDCRATTSTMLPQESLEQEEAVLLSSACVSAWEAKHSHPPLHLRSMEVANLLPTYVEAHSSQEISSGSLQQAGTHPAAAQWCFVLLGTASNSPTIAKAEQQRAGKRHQLPVNSPICALEHLPKIFHLIWALFCTKPSTVLEKEMITKIYFKLLKKKVKRLKSLSRFTELWIAFLFLCQKRHLSGFRSLTICKEVHRLLIKANILD